MKKKIEEQTEIVSSNTLNTNYKKTNSNLDWNAVISKNGENRNAHVLRHTIPNNSRKSHGVFTGNPFDMVNTAWEHRHLIHPISDGMGGAIYNIPYKNAGYESGYINTGVTLNYITIITMENSSALITAFPSLGNYQTSNNSN